MKLYHGSNVKVENINLSMSRPAKDFGRAFYLSAEIEQAKEMARFKVETFGGDVVVNVFEFDTSVLEELKVLHFSIQRVLHFNGHFVLNVLLNIFIAYESNKE